MSQALTFTHSTGGMPHPVSESESYRSRQIHVALVDDEEDFREATCLALSDFGFVARAFAGGEEILGYLAQGGRPDVIVLDWKLSDMVGIDLLRQLRKAGAEMPIVFFTGVPAANFEAEALELGAADFVDKSRGVSILAKRLRLAIEGGAAATKVKQAMIVDGDLTLNPTICRAFLKGIDLQLTVTEFNIVRRLADSNGDYVRYRSIYDCVHRPGFLAGNGEEGLRTNVRTTIKRIRNKFRAVDPKFSRIENFPAFGYRLRPSHE